METFNLEFKSKIKLWKLLLKRDLFLTKREAKDLILIGMVSVNGIEETRPGVLLDELMDFHLNNFYGFNANEFDEADKERCGRLILSKF